MLSYLKDSHSQVPAASESQTAAPDETATSPSDYLTVSGHGQRLRQSTILLLVLFGVGIAGVWFMIKKTTPVKAMAANDDQQQLEAAIAQLNGMQSEVNTQMDSVVGRFYQFSNVGQIGVDELKKNPFKRESGSGLPGYDEDADRQKQLLQIEDQARRAAAGLQVWSITSTPRGVCCMINDKVLYVGDVVNGLTLTKIENKVVTLEMNGVGVQLKMDE